MPDWVRSHLDVSFIYNLFKTYKSFKWIYNVEVESADLNIFLKEFIEMTLDHEAKSMYTFKGIG